MSEPIPFWNFSLRKVLAHEPDSLKQARIKIVYVTLLLTLVKIIILLPVVGNHLLWHQAFRLAFVFALYLGLIKYLLYRPKGIDVISHIIILTGLGAIWTALLVFHQPLSLITIQFVFMVTFIGYYLINSRYAVVYSVFAIIPVMYYLMMTGQSAWTLDIDSQNLPSPGFELIVALNFVTIVLIHYLFYRAFRDNVVEKEALNRQLQATVAETKALAESRSVFLSTMSHELRTPLNAVIGMTNLIKDGATKEQEENLDILEFSAVSLLTLVNDILDYNKSENDKIELESIPVHLPTLLHKVCSGLRMKAAEKGFGLVLEVDDELKDELVIADPTRLTQIIYNLTGNAIKFTERGQVTVKACAMQHDADHTTINFSVSDTGIGIAPERQEAIFDPFTQASVDTTRHYGGTGLGLAIVKRLLKLFNSAIKLISISGEGSTFSFTIGFEVYKGNTKPVTAQSLHGDSLSGLRVLIAEDNAVNSLLLVKLLQKWDVTTTVSKNGQQAIEEVLNSSFDAILMDLHMPEMDGYQATTNIRQLSDPTKAKVHIIALTASVSHNIGDKIQEAGMDDYLSKPFQPTALYTKLEAIHPSQSKALAG